MKEITKFFEKSSLPHIYIFYEARTEEVAGVLTGTFYSMFENPIEDKEYLIFPFKEPSNINENWINSMIKSYMEQEIFKLNKLLEIPLKIDNFVEIEFTDFFPVGFKNETYDELIEIIKSNTIKNKLIKARDFPDLGGTGKFLG